MALWPFKKQLGSGQPDMTAQTLADIARGMQHAVNSTQELVEDHYRRVFERYFEDDGDPIVKRFKLPNGYVMDVPLISLVPPSSLNLKEMKVQMSVHVDKTEAKSAIHTHVKSGATRTSFNVSFAPGKGTGSGGPLAKDSSRIDIEMTFVAGDSPEGVARVIEQYANTLLPKKGEGPAPDGAASTPTPPAPTPEGSSAPPSEGPPPEQPAQPAV